MENENILLGKDNNVTLQEIIEVMPRMPNSVMKEFYTRKITDTLKTIQPNIIELYNLVGDFEIEASELNFIIELILKVENSKWEELTEENILPKVKTVLNQIKNIEEFENNSIINQVSTIIQPWLSIEENIKLTNQDNYYGLYKYIYPEEFRIQILNELADIYQEMF